VKTAKLLGIFWKFKVL